MLGLLERLNFCQRTSSTGTPLIRSLRAPQIENAPTDGSIQFVVLALSVLDVLWDFGVFVGSIR